LPSLLKALEIDQDTQLLVFSKTSFQLRLISPQTPRALYFNDDVYVGYVPGGDVVEISVADTRQGAIFYTLDQTAAAKPPFVRRTHDCLQCHASSVTQGVPGHLIRSVYPDPEGHPILRAGSFVTTEASRMSERWGGWYVTGQHGAQRHMGNTTLARDAREEQFDREAGANLLDLAGRCNLSNYLLPHSDLIAHLVLTHQTHVHNLITAANYQTRLALHDQRIMDEMLGRTSGEPSDSTKRRIQTAGEKLVEGLLFCKEVELQEPVQGTSGFAAQFAQRGPMDQHGRSLRHFDLEHRLFKYPCSYLIYTAAFDALPELMKDYVFQRLAAVLSGNDTSDKFAHLDPEERQAVQQILLETKPEFAKRVRSGT
jgi:hypothetical protein